MAFFSIGVNFNSTSQKFLCYFWLLNIQSTLYFLYFSYYCSSKCIGYIPEFRRVFYLTRISNFASSIVIFFIFCMSNLILTPCKTLYRKQIKDLFFLKNIKKKITTWVEHSPKNSMFINKLTRAMLKISYCMSK